ncbi:MAG: hypothetical protein QM729_08815 [Solirubrobacterales bacterium]
MAIFAITALIGTAGAAAHQAPGGSGGHHGPGGHHGGGSCAELTVAAEETDVLTTTTHLCKLTIASGATLTSTEGTSLTLTVNGVETGSVLTETGGTETALAAGTYTGDVVLTVSEEHPVTFGSLVFPFRQALYVDGEGVETGKSVLAAVSGGQVTDSGASGIDIRSNGEAFNGVYVDEGEYTLEHPTIRFDGNGRSDFVGYGAAIVGSGENTNLVIDHADISNHGVVRTGVIATEGSNVVVKNSSIRVRNGELPEGYVSTVNTELMEDAPWMLGISGNVRATNLLGDGTKATYINSTIASEGWGALSVDNGSEGKLTAIDSTVANTGEDGYGSYAIGEATERFLGDHFNVASYATINRGGDVTYTDSTHKAVAALNEELELGLSKKEIAALPVRPTVINSRRFGVMWHGAGSVHVKGGTQVNSRETTFLDKGQEVEVTVDGSEGAQLNPRNGVLMQLMENDDPGPVMVEGSLVNEGVYTEPTGEVVKDSGFDVYEAQEGDAQASFSDIALSGNFYNGYRGSESSGKNLDLSFDDTHLTGVVSATEAHHAVSEIDSSEYHQLGEVTNTPSEVVNNGVVVDLEGASRWTVTGTSYLSSLTVGSGAKVVAPKGKSVTMTVDGVATAIVPGTTYTGQITLSVG